MTRDLVFVGDVHLDRDDADLPAFLAFLDGLAPSARTLVLLGDLFNLWIGRIDLEQPHQRAVVEVLTSLRRRGVGVRDVEGNRDYRIADAYAGRAFDDVAVRGLTERIGDRSVFAIHGDLADNDNGGRADVGCDPNLSDGGQRPGHCLLLRRRTPADHSHRRLGWPAAGHKLGGDVLEVAHAHEEDRVPTAVASRSQ